MLRTLLSLVFATFFGATLSFGQGLFEQAKPWLGVAIDAGKTGVLVKDVIDGTPAKEYGLKAGDEITAIAGSPVKTAEALIKAVQGQGVGNMVVVRYLRDGKEKDIKVKLV